MKTMLFILILSISMIGISAQSLSPSVIALAGGLEKSPTGMTLSWTIGEPIIETLQTENSSLTQGFQQPNLQASTGFEDASFDYSLRTFPNPASTELIMETDFPKSMQFRIVDMQGKLVEEGSWSTKHQLNVSQLPSGVYALYFQVEGRMIKSELIQKQ